MIKYVVVIDAYDDSADATQHGYSAFICNSKKDANRKVNDFVNDIKERWDDTTIESDDDFTSIYVDFGQGGGMTYDIRIIIGEDGL